MYKRKIQNIFKWGENNLLFLLMLSLGLMFLGLRWKDFLEIYYVNPKIISLLLPFIFLFLAMWIKSKNRELILVFSSIVIALLLFLFQSFELNITKLNSIMSANDSNCIIAKGINDTLGGLEQKSLRYILIPFVIEPYKENMGFIYNKFGHETGDYYREALLRMEIINRHIDSVKELNIKAAEGGFSLESSLGKAVEKENKGILKYSKEIEENICQNLFISK